MSALVPPPQDERVILAALPIGERIAGAIAVGIDATWLLQEESGAQVFVSEMLKALARLDGIGRIVLLSDRGVIPASLNGVPKVTGSTWTAAIASGELLDVLHRPYQPGAETDFARYRRVARTVAITVLDFIAYDNPAYHESPLAFRRYRRAFDEKVCQADQVFAISRHIGDRVQRQFAHRLLAPVRPVLLGADHLDAAAYEPHPGKDALAQLLPKQFVAVLGNDFAHKNRDFAVKVFAEMCRRGYEGRLVLAGFHLDAGSSYDFELDGAGEFASRVLRVGALPSDQKTWLLRHAAAILYPTSSEGFGLVPFEAAALGTPTAFVRFGPLTETMSAVPSASAWRVPEFTDHVLSLVANPAPFVAAVNEAARALTWAACAVGTIAGYRAMLREDAAWHGALAKRTAPDFTTRAIETLGDYWRRAGARSGRLIRRVKGN